MAYVATMSYRGMGTAAQTAQEVQVGGTVAASGAAAVLGSIAASGGSVLGLTGAALSAAVPIVGAALAAVTLVVQYLVANSGCGQTCIETSSWANSAAQALQQNLDAYFALPAPRTQSQQALAIANFNTIWAQLVAACGQAGTGNAGVRCISDRQQGACTWKQTKTPVYPGEPAIGACWNWWNGYLGPIQQDTVVADTVDTALTSAATSVSGTLDSLFSGSGSSVGLLLVAGIVLWAVTS
jgi:hypothetical protein